MCKPKSKYTKIALDSIISFIEKGNTDDLEIKKVPEEMDIRRACFVTLHKIDGSLRGCMGTIEPVRENLHLEIIRNSVSSAFHDYRFESVTKNELNQIELSVSVLSKPEKIKSIEELDPEIYGIIVSDGGFRKGVLLPAIKTVDTIEKQIDIAKSKGGLQNMNNKSLVIYKFTTKTYY